MEHQKLQILESLIILCLYGLIYFIIKTVINNSLKTTSLQRARRKIIIKALQLLVSIIAISFLTAVWGFRQGEIVAFAGAVLTAMGIAFFAQWYLLSNITSGIILFFNHPLKIGDTIKVLDKDYPFGGEITDLSYFFVNLKTEKGEIITISNSQILQKSISVISTQHS